MQEVDQLMTYVTDLNTENRGLKNTLLDKDAEKDAQLVSWAALAGRKAERGDRKNFTAYTRLSVVSASEFPQLPPSATIPLFTSSFSVFSFLLSLAFLFPLLACYSCSPTGLGSGAGRADGRAGDYRVFAGEAGGSG